jgi:chemotaxis protein methyltransferase CheR
MPVEVASGQDESMSNADFGRLKNLIYARSGINLSLDKKTMLELRVKRRVHSLKLNSFGQYCEYLFGAKGQKQEIVHLLDVVSTNKTDFFREPDHFDFLARKALPDLMSRNDNGRPLLVWSAGCSSGEEPYTLAIVMSEYALAHPGFRFHILATDLSTTVLAKAERAVFDKDVVKPVAAPLQRKYFMKHRDAASPNMRVVPELRQTVEFARVNFMDEDFGLGQKADVIFCRNVIIYFDRATQERILQKLAANLAPQGYFFAGHSESLHGMDLPFAAVAPASYRKE